MLKSSVPIISFVGYSGSGKTTLLTKVIREFKQNGYRVGTLKHDAHRFEMDHEGKDTWNYAKSGSDLVIINSSDKLAMIEKLEKPISFEEVISKIENVDVLFVEGYKHESPPKILLIRREKDIQLLNELKDVVAIVTSLPIENNEIPIYDLNDYMGIVELIQSNFLGEKNYGTRK